MINAIINSIATQLVQQNSWLSEVRCVGYLQRETVLEARDRFIVTDFEKDIGITDAKGNSGYIRFGSDTNFSIEEGQAFGGCAANQRITYNMRLVIVAKTTIPEDVSLLLTIQLKQLAFPAAYRANMVKVIPKSGGNNSTAIVINESGNAQWSQENRAMYIDFNIQFTISENCGQIIADMACNNCENILDLGCHQHCDSVPIGIDANYTGTMTLKTIFNGTSVVQTFEVTNGEEIAVPLDGLNENYEFDIQLLGEDGELFSLEYPSETYDCVKIKVMP